MNTKEENKSIEENESIVKKLIEARNQLSVSEDKPCLKDRIYEAIGDALAESEQFRNELSSVEFVSPSDFEKELAENELEVMRKLRRIADEHAMDDPVFREAWLGRFSYLAAAKSCDKEEAFEVMLRSMRWVIGSPFPIPLNTYASRFAYNCDWFILNLRELCQRPGVRYYTKD